MTDEIIEALDDNLYTSEHQEDEKEEEGVSRNNVCRPSNDYDARIDEYEDVDPTAATTMSSPPKCQLPTSHLGHRVSFKMDVPDCAISNVNVPVDSTMTMPLPPHQPWRARSIINPPPLNSRLSSSSSKLYNHRQQQQYYQSKQSLRLQQQHHNHQVKQSQQQQRQHQTQSTSDCRSKYVKRILMIMALMVALQIYSYLGERSTSLDENYHDDVVVEASVAPSRGIMDGSPHPSRSERRAVWEGEYGQSDWSKVPPHLRGYYSKMNGRYDDGVGNDGVLSSNGIASIKAGGRTTTSMSMKHLHEKDKKKQTSEPVDGLSSPSPETVQVPLLDVFSDVVELKEKQLQGREQNKFGTVTEKSNGGQQRDPSADIVGLRLKPEEDQSTQPTQQPWTAETQVALSHENEELVVSPQAQLANKVAQAQAVRGQQERQRVREQRRQREREQLRQEQQTNDSLREKNDEEENIAPQEQAVHDARPPPPLQSMARGRFEKQAKVVSQQQSGSKNADTAKVDTSNISELQREVLDMIGKLKKKTTPG